jgi:hypothetical protein
MFNEFYNSINIFAIMILKITQCGYINFLFSKLFNKNILIQRLILLISNC